eukprot:2757452-Rhodomonas_salina.2
MRTAQRKGARGKAGEERGGVCERTEQRREERGRRRGEERGEEGVWGRALGMRSADLSECSVCVCVCVRVCVRVRACACVCVCFVRAGVRARGVGRTDEAAHFLAHTLQRPLFTLRIAPRRRL